MSLRPPTTGAFIEAPEQHFAGQCDPITLEQWHTQRWPVIMHENSNHFYDLSQQPQQLHINPLTRAPLLRSDALEPILHRETRVAEYVDMLRELGRARGWNYRDILLADMYALAHSLGQRPYAVHDETLLGTHLLRWAGEEAAFVDWLWELAGLPPPAPPGTSQHPPRR